MNLTKKLLIVDTAVVDTNFFFLSLFLSFFLSSLIGNTAAVVIQLLSFEKHVLEGADVTLSCNYSAATGNRFQWYRQYPGSRPEFLLYLTEFNNVSDSALCLTAEAKKQLACVDLNISHVGVSDSALYYCVLQPTVTGNSTTLYKTHSTHTTFAIKIVSFDTITGKILEDCLSTLSYN